MGQRAVVVGATGLVGGHLVREILADPHYASCLAIVRRPLAFEHSKLEVRVVDFGKLEAEAFEAHDAFSALGTTIKQAGSKEAFKRVDCDYVVAFAGAAKRSCSTFVHVSALGADARSSVFYNRVKGEAEAALEALGFGTCVAMRPSLLEGEREVSRLGEAVGSIFLGALGALPFAAARRIRPIQGADVARAMVALAKEARPGARVVLSDEIHRIADTSRNGVAKGG